MEDRWGGDRRLKATPDGPPDSGKTDPTPGKPHLVGELLPRLFKKWGLAKDVARQEALVRWDPVVGERIAAVAQATAVSKGVLFVRVASSAWLTELNLMRHDILRRLNAGQREGRVERIVFTLSEGATDPRDSS